MSATKRTNKTKEELTEGLEAVQEKKTQMAMLEKLKEVQDEFGYNIIGMMDRTYRGDLAVWGIEKRKAPLAEVKKEGKVDTK